MPHATRKHPARGTGIQLPPRLAKPLAKIAARAARNIGGRITKTQIALAGLAYMLPRLEAGEFRIVDGAIEPVTK